MVQLIALLFLLLAALWFWLLLGVRKSGRRWLCGTLALQLSALMTLLVLFLGSGWAALIGFVWPLPTAIPVSALLLQHSNFYADFYYLPLGAGFSLAVIAAIFQPFRIWTPLIVAAVAIPLALPMAEKHSRNLMCQRASDLGAEHIQRHSFLWSLRLTRTNFLGEAHGLTTVDAQSYAWSYRHLDWYPIAAQPQGQPGYIQTACSKA